MAGCDSLLSTAGITATRPKPGSSSQRLPLRVHESMRLCQTLGRLRSSRLSTSRMSTKNPSLRRTRNGPRRCSALTERDRFSDRRDRVSLRRCLAPGSGLGFQGSQPKNSARKQTNNSRLAPSVSRLSGPQPDNQPRCPRGSCSAASHMADAMHSFSTAGALLHSR